MRTDSGMCSCMCCVPCAGCRNIIDPMQMVAKWHDNYPKQDLDKNYLGDGLPPCADLPKVQGSMWEVWGAGPPGHVAAKRVTR